MLARAAAQQAAAVLQVLRVDLLLVLVPQVEGVDAQALHKSACSVGVAMALVEFPRGPFFVQPFLGPGIFELHMLGNSPGRAEALALFSQRIQS